MSAGAIGGVGTSQAIEGAFGSLKSADFMNVLLSELSNQDPFEPADSSALLEQLSSLRNIESQLSLQKSIETLVNQNRLASSAGLIGRGVAGLGDNGLQVQGVVQSIRIEGGEAILELSGGKSVRASNLSRILDPSGAGDGETGPLWDVADAQGNRTPDGVVDATDVAVWNQILLENMNREYRAADFADGRIPPDKVGQKFLPRGFGDGDFNRDGVIDAADIQLVSELAAEVFRVSQAAGA